MTNYKRQTDLFDPADFENVRVVIVGLGNIGSHTALALARMGIQKFTLVDFDTVEAHNLASQAYTIEYLDTGKVNAIAEMILAINPNATVCHESKAYQETSIVYDADTIMVCAVDSMTTRYEICEMIEGTGCMVFDGRMGGGQVEVHAQYAKDWRATLTHDADTDPCSARYISYTSYIIAGLLTNTIKRYLNKEKYTKKLVMHTNNYDVIKIMS